MTLVKKHLPLLMAYAELMSFQAVHGRAGIGCMKASAAAAQVPFDN